MRGGSFIVGLSVLGKGKHTVTDLQLTGSVVGVVTGIIGALTGIGGLAVSIIVYLNNRRDRQPSVTVVLNQEVAVVDNKMITFLCVAGVNTGLRTVRLEEAGIMLPDRRKLLYYLPNLSDSLPTELSEGQKCAQRLDITKVARLVKDSGYGAGVKLVGYMRDARSVYHTSKPTTFDPDKWLTSVGDMVG